MYEYIEYMRLLFFNKIVIDIMECTYSCLRFATMLIQKDLFHEYSYSIISIYSYKCIYFFILFISLALFYMYETNLIYLKNV